MIETYPDCNVCGTDWHVKIYIDEDRRTHRICGKCYQETIECEKHGHKKLKQVFPLKEDIGENHLD